jgi:hypothetical protein
MVSSSGCLGAWKSFSATITPCKQIVFIHVENRIRARYLLEEMLVDGYAILLGHQHVGG